MFSFVFNISAISDLQTLVCEIVFLISLGHFSVGCLGAEQQAEVLIRILMIYHLTVIA